MVLARVGNVKSGWKSMFMVFTTAAGDEQPTIVRLAFETIEKIVREHFDFITETEITTFTDCVNCLIAFTNNPHSIDVSLNAIAFLRFCAMKLAEGAIGEWSETWPVTHGQISVNCQPLCAGWLHLLLSLITVATSIMHMQCTSSCSHFALPFTPHSVWQPRHVAGMLAYSLSTGRCGFNWLVNIATGNVELELPEGTPDFNPDRNRIKPSAGEPDEDTWISNSRRTTVEGGLPTVPEGALDARTSNGSMKLLGDLTTEELAAAQQQQQTGLQVGATLYCMSLIDQLVPALQRGASACHVQGCVE